MQIRDTGRALFTERERPSMSPRWQEKFDQNFAQTGSYTPVALGDGTVAVNRARGLAAFHPDGSTAWEVGEGHLQLSRPAAGPGDRVYVRDTDALYAVEDGAVQWTHPLDDSQAAFGANPPSVGPDGTVYLSTNDHRLLILEPDGELQQEVAWGPLASRPPGLLPDGRVLLHGANGQAVVEPGKPGLQLEVRSDVFRPAGINPDGTVYRIQGSRLDLFEPDGETLRYSADLGHETARAQVLLRPDGSLVVVGNEERLTALGRSGETLWQWEAGGSLSPDMVVAEDGRIHLTVYADTWRTVSLAPDGQESWSRTWDEFPGHVQAGPKGTVVLGEHYQPLRVLDGTTGEVLGEQKWRRSYGDFVEVGPDGTLFVASAEGTLAAFEVATAADVDRQREEALAAVPEEIAVERREVHIGDVSLPRQGE